jgi:hypothetical protein
MRTIQMHLLLTTIHQMTLLRRCRRISRPLEFFPVENSVISCPQENLAPPAYAQIPGAISLRHLVAYLPRIGRRACPRLSPPRRRRLTPQRPSRACHLARPQPHLPAQPHLRPRDRRPPARPGRPTPRQRPCLRCMGGSWVYIGSGAPGRIFCAHCCAAGGIFCAHCYATGWIFCAATRGLLASAPSYTSATWDQEAQSVHRRHYTVWKFSYYYS